ncbi:MAG: hypothetical protein ACFFC6_01140, partial [Promethearchaeota archaeon]
GEVSGVNISINYFSNFQWLNWTSTMRYNGSHYIYSTQMLCNSSFSYFLKVYDKALNINITSISNHRTLNFNPVTALSHGVDFNLPELNPGEARFWIQTNDTFEDHPFDYNITLSIFDETDALWILSEKYMDLNGTHFIFTFAIGYLHYFSYYMTLIDPGTLEGYYEANQYFDTNQMLDYWEPIIHDVGIQDISETSKLIWANVSENENWGSGVANVTLYYDFSPSEGGGSGSEYKKEEMIFNGSLYTYNLIVNESGTLNWFVEAFDVRNSSKSENLVEDINIPREQFGISLLEMILVVVGLVSGFILVVLASTSLQKWRVRRTQWIREIDEKLAIIPNIYTILVSTEVGVPVFTITNIMYQKDETLNDALSGLSVGIDAFLQSFQTDFLQQLQLEDFEVSERASGINIRMSVIEQHQVQVLIAATQMFRVFVFLREKPSNFTREAFSNIIEELEKTVHIQDLGIVDERIYGPQVEAVLQKYFPLTLLEPFVIDTLKIRNLDEGLKRGRTDIPISRAGLNSLKSLVVAHTLPERAGQHPEKIFNEAVDQGLLLESRMLLYNDAKNILSKLLKIPPELIYEALWSGCSPRVRVIIPQRV